jgi:hypothetical protein
VEGDGEKVEAELAGSENFKTEYKYTKFYFH